MSTTSVNLLRAACEIAGGETRLARRLGISETLLAKFMDGVLELPDPVLLRAVDVILEDRQSRLPPNAPLGGAQLRMESGND